MKKKKKGNHIRDVKIYAKSIQRNINSHHLENLLCKAQSCNMLGSCKILSAPLVFSELPDAQHLVGSGLRERA